MIPLIDADILLYEIASSGQFVDDDGELVIKNFDSVSEHFDQRVQEICAEAMATEPPLLFLTATEPLVKMVNRVRKFEGKPLIVFKPNFREEVATVKPYKGNRKDTIKPVHFDNLLAYIASLPGLRVAVGIEADDLMSMYQTSREESGILPRSIICSRDKDLMMVPGMHYSWECGKQPHWGPDEVTELGYIALVGNKIKGNGLRFFYSQLLTGDTVDNIPGCPGVGPAKCVGLQDCVGEWALFEFVKTFYEKKYGDEWEERIIEQGNLLWMRRRAGDVWKPPSPPN